MKKQQWKVGLVSSEPTPYKKPSFSYNFFFTKKSFISDRYDKRSF